jgi:quercetin dioxygenase-like cupin family protein
MSADRKNLRHIDEVPFQKVWQGISGRIVEGDRITLGVIELAPNGTVPSHTHDNEQVGVCIRGQLSFTVGDETRTFGPGGSWVVPSMVPHGAATGPDGATVVEAFNPIRDDWHVAPIDEDVEPRWP